MTDRERLIELIVTAENEVFRAFPYTNSTKRIEMVADYLLENGVIVPFEKSALNKWIEKISGMVFDVNPAEIASHIQDGTLKEWCLNWQKSMNMLIIMAPLDYSKEREENEM